MEPAAFCNGSGTNENTVSQPVEAAPASPGTQCQETPASRSLPGINWSDRARRKGRCPRAPPTIGTCPPEPHDPPPVSGAGIQPNHRSTPSGNPKASVWNPQDHGTGTLPRGKAEKGRDKHGKTRSEGGAAGGCREARSTENVSTGNPPGRVSDAARSAVVSGPTTGDLSTTLPSTLGALPCWLPSRSLPPHPPSQAQTPTPSNTIRPAQPPPTSLAAPSPETTSASLGPTVWQLPMARAGRRALRHPSSSSRQPAPTRTASRAQPIPPPPAAPLRGRSPAGSVATEGGADTV